MIPDVTFTNDVNCDAIFNCGCSSSSNIKLPDGSFTKNCLLFSDNIISGRIADDISNLLPILYLCIFFSVEKAICHRCDYFFFDIVFIALL